MTDETGLHIIPALMVYFLTMTEFCCLKQMEILCIRMVYIIACSILDEHGNVRVYFSATTSENKTAIGLLKGSSFNEIQPVQRIEATKILLTDGKTVNDRVNHLESGYITVFNSGNSHKQHSIDLIFILKQITIL